MHQHFSQNWSNSNWANRMAGHRICAAWIFSRAHNRATVTHPSIMNSHNKPYQILWRKFATVCNRVYRSIIRSSIWSRKILTIWCWRRRHHHRIRWRWCAYCVHSFNGRQSHGVNTLNVTLLLRNLSKKWSSHRTICSILQLLFVVQPNWNVW